MANTHSPTRFNGEADNFFDPNFTFDINKKMRVPKSIRVTGNHSNDDIHMTNGNWNPPVDKFEMNVPDRILVVGQEQHVGTKAPPIEISIENSVLPQERESVRCVTPPRVLKLDNHYFPTADEDERSFKDDTLELVPNKQNDIFNGENHVVRHLREQTPAFNLDSTLPLAPGEEVQHLRRQVGKLNRRIIAIESEIQQQQQRMKLLYIVTAVYICFKTMFWFGKN